MQFLSESVTCNRICFKNVIIYQILLRVYDSVMPVLFTPLLIKCYQIFSLISQVFAKLRYFFLIFTFMIIVTILCLFLFSFWLLQLFKEELSQVKEGMKQVNDLAHQLAISDVHLSMENARALEHLNSRWKVLQVEFIGRFDAASSTFSCRMCR